MESVLAVSLLSISLITKNGTGNAFITWQMIPKLGEATSTLEDRINLIMLVTKWRNTKQEIESNSIRTSAKFMTW